MTISRIFNFRVCFSVTWVLSACSSEEAGTTGFSTDAGFTSLEASSGESESSEEAGVDSDETGGTANSETGDEDGDDNGSDAGDDSGEADAGADTEGEGDDSADGSTGETGAESGTGDDDGGDSDADDAGETGDSPCSGLISVTLRDFSVSHPDMQAYLGQETGIVEATLGMDSKPVYAGDPMTGTMTTSSQAAFNEWYNDVPGVNKSSSQELQFIEGTPGIWSFDSDAFFPLDVHGDNVTDESFGFQGFAHNYHFTLELHSEFTYEGGEVFTFSGDDDVFLFINGQLAIDLGGVHAELTQSIDLDVEAATLGIAPGGLYSFDFFFAERRTSASNFHIDTTIGCLLPS